MNWGTGSKRKIKSRIDNNKKTEKTFYRPKYINVFSIMNDRLTDNVSYILDAFW